MLIKKTTAGKKKNGLFWALKYDFVNLKCLRMLKKRAL
jgi:hypothetical protein